VQPTISDSGEDRLDQRPYPNDLHHSLHVGQRSGDAEEPRVRFIFRQTETYGCMIFRGLPRLWMAATHSSLASAASWKRAVPSALFLRQNAPRFARLPTAGTMGPLAKGRMPTSVFAPQRK
jgi:hypothetical protein